MSPKINKSIYKFEVKRFYIGEMEESYHIDTPDSVTTFLKSIDIHNSPVEHLVVLILDPKNNIKGYYTVSQGLIDRSHCHPREVFRVAIIQGASKLIIAHNHPSGDCTPSRQDYNVTEVLAKAGELLGIKVLDHIVVGEKNGVYTDFSMRNHGTFPIIGNE